jgi:hypothetical protein
VREQKFLKLFRKNDVNKKICMLIASIKNNVNTLLSAVPTHLQTIFLLAIATLRAVIGNCEARQVKLFEKQRLSEGVEALPITVCGLAYVPLVEI